MTALAPKVASISCLLLSSSITLAGTESWTFDLTTEGEDASWTSPSAVDPDAVEYDGTYELTTVEVGISWNGIPFGEVDVTDEVPPEFQQGQQIVDGPAPVLLLDGTFTYPEPPEDTAVQATVRVELNGDGFGHVSVTDVTLGTLDVDLGSPFGVQTVQITSIRVTGTLDVTPIVTAPGDLNADGIVNVSDMLLLLGDWGACPAKGACPADLNDDGNVNVSDLLQLLANWG